MAQRRDGNDEGFFNLSRGTPATHALPCGTRNPRFHLKTFLWFPSKRKEKTSEWDGDETRKGAMIRAPQNSRRKRIPTIFFQQVHATHRHTDNAMSILLETKNAHSQGGEKKFRACCAVPKQTEIRNLNSDSTLAQTWEQVRRIRLPDPAITRIFEDLI